MAQVEGRGLTLLPRPVAFVGFAVTLVVVYLASGAPTPLFVVWQSEWHFPDSLLTVAFASYAFSFLVALLLGGSLSDHVGRKPVIIGALLLGLVSLSMYIFATGIEWIIAARTLGGLSTGVVTAAFTAALVELKPGSRTGPTIAAAATVAGLGLGAVLSGIGVELWGRHADEVLFTSFAALTVLGIVVAIFGPETTTRVPGALRSLVPQVVVPRAARSFFVRMMPILVAAWMAGAVFLALSPTIIQEILGIESGFLNGFTASIHALSVSIGSVVFGKLPVRNGLRLGGIGLVAGMTLVVIGVAVGVLPLVWIGGLIEGMSFGAAFGAIFRGLAPLAPEHERAGTFAAVYVVAYLALGVPAVIAGQLIAPFGLFATILSWSVLILVLAAIGMLMQFRRPRETMVTP